MRNPLTRQAKKYIRRPLFEAEDFQGITNIILTRNRVVEKSKQECKVNLQLD